MILRDFSILKGGHFGVLATGVDNLTIDNLKIDTDRDGMDIDCCHNVRVSNCSVNSPWDDGICPKSSFALGYGEPPEFDDHELLCHRSLCAGDHAGGTYKRWPADFKVAPYRPHQVRYGIERRVEEHYHFELRASTVAGGLRWKAWMVALLEDITFTGVTMRDCTNTPLFLRLGSRMSGPGGSARGHAETSHYQ